MRQHPAAGVLGVLVLLLSCGCSGSDGSGGDSEASAPASSTVSAPKEAAAVSCDPLPDMPTDTIAYTQIHEDGSRAIYLMNPDGTDKRCLVDTAGPDSSPAWSPDGRWLAFQGGTVGQEDLYVVRADGTGLRQLTDTPEWEEMPVWSPDGRRIAYNMSRVANEPPWAIRVMKADGSRGRSILSSGEGVIWAEMRDWSPDGRTLLIATDSGGGTDLVQIRPDGSGRRLIRAEPGDFGAGAAYSPDSLALVFQADLDGGCIYRSDPDVKHMVKLTSGCSIGVDLTWSPDGRQILWAGADGGDLESMLRDGRQRRTIVDSGDVAQPDWQPQIQDRD